MKTGLTKLLRAHLNVSWLRPVSAFWDTIASSLISKYDFVSPSLDLCCGHGIFSFITAGGNLSIDYDHYLNADTEGFWDNKDIYDTDKTDVLNKFIIKNPKYTFTAGLDHKSSLLKQAKSLNFYQRLVKHDANRRLPFKDEEFRTVFSNAIYWLGDLKKSLKEIHRILGQNGIAILCMPNDNFLDICFTYKWKESNSELLRLLNRGRSDCMQWTISYDGFSVLAKEAGFDIADHSYYLSPLTLKVWDIGLRPLLPLLIEMANRLSPEDKKRIKSEWIGTATRFFLPLYEIEKKSRKKCGFHLFVLRKK